MNENNYYTCTFCGYQSKNIDDIFSHEKCCKNKPDGKIWEIYEEGFITNGLSGDSCYIGIGIGDTFLDACKEYINRTHRGEIREKDSGEEYACSWGCEWYPTREQASFFDS